LEYLANIWALILFNKCCDICKDFRIEKPSIYCSELESEFLSGRLEKPRFLHQIPAPQYIG
jgi:hypothetical protein